jgi:hypothetical protein
MSEPAPTPPTPEEIAAAVARAERRLVLLDVMLRFCMALLRALEPGGAAGALLIHARVRALAAISRAVRLAIRLAMETRRLLRDVNAGVFPAPKAGRARPGAPFALSTEPAETLDEEDREDVETLDRDVHERVETESDTAFRRRLDAFETLLDQDAGGPDWSADETVRILCRVLGLKPDWSGWLGDEWIEENLDLRRLLADTRAARTSSSAPPAGGRPTQSHDRGRSHVSAPPPRGLPPPAWGKKPQAPPLPPPRAPLLMSYGSHGSDWESGPPDLPASPTVGVGDP